MGPLNAVEVLEDRLGFLESVQEIAQLCNWSPAQVEELHYYLLDEIIRIDNIMFDIHDETGSIQFAYNVWERHVEELRRWLCLVLGVKLRLS